MFCDTADMCVVMRDMCVVRIGVEEGGVEEAGVEEAGAVGGKW